MALAIVQALLVGFVPGYLAFRLPILARERRASLHADERIFWSVVLSVSWSLSVTLGLAAIDSYRFDTLLTINVALSLVLALWGRGRLAYRGTAKRLSASAFLPLLIVVTAAWLYRPASEFIVGGKDPGAYMNEGIQIAQRGAFLVHDPVVAKVPQATRDLFFPFYGTSDYYSLRFMGFFVKDPQAGTVVGQFPHLFPASIAIGYGLNGLSGARDTVVWWTLLGFAAVYLLGARLFGRGPAFAATALLALNVVIVWFARYPNAEVVMLALLSAAILATTRALTDGDRAFGALAGWLLVLLLFLRFDAVIGVAAIVTAITLAHTQGHRIGAAFWLVLVAGIALWWPYLTGPMAGYAQYPLLFTRNQGVIYFLALGVVAVMAVFRISVGSRMSRLIRTATPLTMAVVLVTLGLYAFFFRVAAGKLAPHDADSLRTFAWYVGLGPLALLAIAIPTVARQLFWRDPAFFTTASAYALFFFYKIRIVPEHFWMSRRFVPVILPATLLLVCALAAWLTRRIAWRVWPRGASVAAAAAVVVVAAPIAWQSARLSAPVIRHVEYAGLIPKLEQLAQRFTAQDLVVVESRNASDAHVLALPLAYIYARNVILLASPAPDKRLVETFIDDARKHYGAIYFLGGGGTDLLTKRVGVQPVDGDRFQVAEYDAPINAYPQGVKRKEFDYGIYRFVDAQGLATQAAITIGDDDDLQVLRFHAKEQDPRSGRTYRWTRDASYLSLLNLTPSSSQLVLSMANGNRPAAAGTARVTVSIGDVVLGTADVDGDIREHAFGIPPGIAARGAASEDPTRVKIAVSTWVPRTAIGAPDDRELGVMLWRAEVR
ncbi:MAG: glycosyltransferase family 39 protein [Acidobacteria bacterium]|nr:glycosyltransferase family 39 protein [Acidobacteriota bacterium]